MKLCDQILLSCQKVLNVIRTKINVGKALRLTIFYPNVRKSFVIFTSSKPLLKKFAGKTFVVY